MLNVDLAARSFFLPQIPQLPQQVWIVGELNIPLHHSVLQIRENLQPCRSIKINDFIKNTKFPQVLFNDVCVKLLRTLTQGKNSEKVLDLVANTFRALVDYAEWNVGPKNVEEKKTKEKENEPKPNFVEKSDGDPDDDGGLGGKLKKTELHYNIQIHLPESRDQAVHDALFRSLKKHLF